MANTPPKGMASAPPAVAPTPDAQVQLALIDKDKAISVEHIKENVVKLQIAEAEKQRAHEVQKQRIDYDEAQRARLTIVGTFLVVLFTVAAGLAFYADRAFGKEIVGYVGTLIGGILGGLGIGRVVTPKPPQLPSKDGT